MTTSIMNDNNIKAFNKIKHRGPDMSSLITTKSAVVGFHRLAINDLSEDGMQPFISTWSESTIYVICNGEIYNYKELIKNYDLQSVYKSLSDCEVILHLFIKFNHDIKRLLNVLIGEFAFIIHVEHTNGNHITYTGRDQVGVRPLFYCIDQNEHLIGYASEMKGLIDICDGCHIQQIEAGTYHTVNSDNKVSIDIWYDFEYLPNFEISYDDLQHKIVDTLIQCVEDRIISDRPIGALLSGGLDSSLVVSILARYLAKVTPPRPLICFSIGTQDSPDVISACIVVDHIKRTLNPNIFHHIVSFEYLEAIDNIDAVIYTGETCDITSIRAMSAQYLLAKYIADKTDIKVILNGDGSDEITMGYQYFKNAPNAEEAQQETIKLIKNIQYYDGLRVDRTISRFGLEARTPFLDIRFIDLYMSIPPEHKIPKGRIEKHFLREAFDKFDPDLLPQGILWRHKEAFSDGITVREKSLYMILQSHFNAVYTHDDIITSNTPTAEACYYKLTYLNHFKNQNIVPYWLPSWSNGTKEPSARTLSIYSSE